MRAQKPIGLILFFFSGMISLVFQVVWLKMLVTVFGNTVWAISTLVTTFMAGLAIGSWLFGRVADRCGSPLRLYGILEGIIGLYALLTPIIFKNLHLIYVPLYQISGSDNVTMGLFKFILAFLILILPTICMGATLPLLAKRFTQDMKTVGSDIGILYTINTFGAVTGTFVTGFFLIPSLGLNRTIIIASTMNFIIFGIIHLLTRRENPGFKLDGLIKSGKKTTANRWILWVYFGCGFAALSYEVIWNRILVLHIGSSVYAYSIMLAIYLLGITLGAAIMSYYIKKIKNHLRVFAIIQILIAFDVILLTNQFGNLSVTLSRMGGIIGASSYASFIFTLIISTVHIILIPTLLFGASFPLAVKLFVQKKDKLGQETGLIYAFNTLGTILGSFCSGFLLIPLFGSQSSLLTIASINLLIGIYMINKPKPYRLKLILLSILGLIIFYSSYFTLTSKNQVILTAGVFENEKGRVKLLFFEEDIYATVTVEERNDQRGSWHQLSMNGVNVAGTSSELFTIQKLQGHLPLLLHNNPKKVLHIGFGSGGTAWSVSRHPVERIVIAEISQSIIKTASRYFKQINHGVLDDKRIEVNFTDGRNKILATQEKYDIILSDSIHPRFSGNGSLYTYDYYMLLKKKLKSNGLVSQWLPFYSITPENFKMIVKSFYRVFPNTSIWFINSTFNDYVIIIGKLNGQMIDFASIESTLRLPDVRSDLEEINCETPYKILDFFLFANETVGDFVGDVPLHTDDNMSVEYLSGRVLNRAATSYVNYASLFKFRTSVNGYLINTDRSVEKKEIILKTMKKYEKATSFNLAGQLLYRQGRRSMAFKKFDKIPILNPDDLEPVEYFGSSFQKPFLKGTEIIRD